MATRDDDHDLPGPAGLCRLAAELVEQALHGVPVIDTRSVASAAEAVVAVDRTLARSYLAMALEHLICADAALLPYVGEDRHATQAPGRLRVLDGGDD